MTRLIARTIKCETNFGKIYIHIDFHPNGMIESVAFSQPGKLDNTTIGEALDVLALEINNAIGDIAEIRTLIECLELGSKPGVLAADRLAANTTLPGSGQ